MNSIKSLPKIIQNWANHVYYKRARRQVLIGMGNAGSAVGEVTSKAWGGIRDYFAGARYDEFMIQHDTHVEIVGLPFKADIEEALGIASFEGFGKVFVIPQGVSAAVAGLAAMFTCTGIMYSIERAVDRWVELHPGEGRCPVYYLYNGNWFEFQSGDGCYYYHRYGTFEGHPVMRKKQFRKYCKCHYTEDDYEAVEKHKSLWKYRGRYPQMSYDYYFG